MKRLRKITRIDEKAVEPLLSHFLCSDLRWPNGLAHDWSGFLIRGCSILAFRIPRDLWSHRPSKHRKHLATDHKVACSSHAEVMPQEEVLTHVPV
jgi:hypothetical protein